MDCSSELLLLLLLLVGKIVLNYIQWLDKGAPINDKFYGKSLATSPLLLFTSNENIIQVTAAAAWTECNSKKSSSQLQEEKKKTKEIFMKCVVHFGEQSQVTFRLKWSKSSVIFKWHSPGDHIYYEPPSLLPSIGFLFVINQQNVEGNEPTRGTSSHSVWSAYPVGVEADVNRWYSMIPELNLPSNSQPGFDLSATNLSMQSVQDWPPVQRGSEVELMG